MRALAFIVGFVAFVVYMTRGEARAVAREHERCALHDAVPVRTIDGQSVCVAPVWPAENR